MFVLVNYDGLLENSDWRMGALLSALLSADECGVRVVGDDFNGDGFDVNGFNGDSFDGNGVDGDGFDVMSVVCE